MPRPTYLSRIPPRMDGPLGWDPTELTDDLPDPTDRASEDAGADWFTPVAISADASRVQEKSGSWADSLTTATTTFDSTPTEGNRLVAFLWTTDSSSAAINQSGWDLVLELTHGYGHLYVYSKVAGASESGTVTCGDAVETKKIDLYEIEGALNAYGGLSDQDAATTTMGGPSITPTADSAGVILEALAVNYATYNVGTLSPDGSLVEVDESYSGNRLRAWLGYRDVASFSGSYEETCTSTVNPGSNSASLKWAAAALAFGGSSTMWVSAPEVNDGDDDTYRAVADDV